MILADTSIWIHHFRESNPTLCQLLASGQTTAHHCPIPRLRISHNLTPYLPMRSLIQKFIQLSAPEDLHINYLELGIQGDDAKNLLRLCRCEHFGDDYLLKTQELADQSGDNTDYFVQYDYAQTHAWRALAQLQNPDHVQEFISLLEQEDLIHNETFTEDFKLFMVDFYLNSCLTPLGNYLFNTNNPAGPASVIAQTLGEIGTIPEAREGIIGMLNHYLGFLPYARQLNAHVVNALTDLQATETLPNIRKIFSDHLVELPICGDLDSCEIALGVRKKRLSPAPTQAQLKKTEHRENILARKDYYSPILEEATATDTLEYTLKVYANETQLSSATELNGFLTAAASSPTPPSTQKISPYIWDRYNGDSTCTPAWPTPSDEKSFRQAFRSVYTTIQNHWKQKEFRPSLRAISKENNAPNHAAWVKGIIYGLDLWHKDNPTKKQAVIRSGYEVITAQEENLPPKETLKLFEEFVQALFHLTATATPSGHNTATKTVTTIIDTDTPRNAPCPCGSGKKYKRCCMP